MACRWPVRQVSFIPKKERARAVNFPTSSYIFCLFWRTGARRGIQFDERPAWRRFLSDRFAYPTGPGRKSAGDASASSVRPSQRNFARTEFRRPIPWMRLPTPLGRWMDPGHGPAGDQPRTQSPILRKSYGIPDAQFLPTRPRRYFFVCFFKIKIVHHWSNWRSIPQN